MPQQFLTTALVEVPEVEESTMVPMLAVLLKVFLLIKVRKAVMHLAVQQVVEVDTPMLSWDWVSRQRLVDYFQRLVMKLPEWVVAVSDLRQYFRTL
jgi:hypothetical protein